MKLPNKYIAIDLETTDLDPKKGDIIQIGAIVINEDFTTGETFNSYIKPLSDYRNPRAMEVNGISEETLATAPSSVWGLELFEHFALAVDRRPVLASWGAYFDIPFLEAYYEKIGRKYPFSFKSLDLKSIAQWEMGKSDIAIWGGLSSFIEARGMQFQGNPHDALDDILNSVALVQSYLQ